MAPRGHPRTEPFFPKSRLACSVEGAAGFRTEPYTRTLETCFATALARSLLRTTKPGMSSSSLSSSLGGRSGSPLAARGATKSIAIGGLSCEELRFGVPKSVTSIRTSEILSTYHWVLHNAFPFGGFKAICQHMSGVAYIFLFRIIKPTVNPKNHIRTGT